MIETCIYKLSSAAYMRQFFPFYLKRRWWVPVVVVAPFVFLSLWDTRFIYVALMSAFFIIPLLLGFAYFYYALSEECVSSIRKSRVVLDKDGFVRILYDDDNEVAGTSKKEWSEFWRCVVDESGVKLFSRKNTISFEFIPANVFPNEKKIELEHLINNRITVCD